MSQRIRIADKLNRLPGEQLVTMAGAVVNGITGNPAFPNPTVDLKAESGVWKVYFCFKVGFLQDIGSVHPCRHASIDPHGDGPTQPCPMPPEEILEGSPITTSGSIEKSLRFVGIDTHDFPHPVTY